MPQNCWIMVPNAHLQESLKMAVLQSRQYLKKSLLNNSETVSADLLESLQSDGTVCGSWHINVSQNELRKVSGLLASMKPIAVGHNVSHHHHFNGSHKISPSMPCCHCFSRQIFNQQLTKKSASRDLQNTLC